MPRCHRNISQVLPPLSQQQGVAASQETEANTPPISGFE